VAPVQLCHGIATLDDDDSDHEKSECIHRIRTAALPIMNAADASKLHFSMDGILLEMDLLRNCSAKSVRISEAVAQRLTGGVSPEKATGLRSGRLKTLDATAGCKLVLPVGHGKGRTLECGAAFFNFLLQQWQTSSRLQAYLPGRKVLYCTFRPQSGVLFVKVGYRALGQRGDAALLGYLEKKSKEMKLTNIRGAGLFVLPLPHDHQGLVDPARAAEESLKSALRDSPVIQSTPSGHHADVASFSSSLEYFFVAARRPGYSPLQALTAVLRGFTGDCELMPRRAVASGGLGLRTGRKRLLPWRSEDSSCEPPAVSSAGSSESPCQGVEEGSAGLALASALRSRQKIRAAAAAIGPFGRRVSRRHNAFLALPAAKRQRRALSCP